MLQSLLEEDVGWSKTGAFFPIKVCGILFQSMASKKGNPIVEDIFHVAEVDKEGKKFDSGLFLMY